MHPTIPRNVVSTITRNVLLSGQHYRMISSSTTRMDIRLPPFMTQNGDMGDVFDELLGGLERDDIETISGWMQHDRVVFVPRGVEVSDCEC